MWSWAPTPDIVSVWWWYLIFWWRSVRASLLLLYPFWEYAECCSLQSRLSHKQSFLYGGAIVKPRIQFTPSVTLYLNYYLLVTVMHVIPAARQHAPNQTHGDKPVLCSSPSATPLSQHGSLCTNTSPFTCEMVELLLSLVKITHWCTPHEHKGKTSMTPLSFLMAIKLQLHSLVNTDTDCLLVHFEDTFSTCNQAFIIVAFKHFQWVSNRSRDAL